MASLVQSLPPLLETALEQLEGGVLPFDAVCQAVDHANAVCCFATAWAHSGGITGGAAALRRTVASAPGRLAPAVASLQQRLTSGQAASLKSPEQLQLQAVCLVLMGCTTLAADCGERLASREVRLQLAKLSMQYIASVGPTLLDYAQDEDAGASDAVARVVSVRMQHQLFLAGLSMRAPGFTAAAAARAAPPEQLAAWLAAALRALKWLENDSDRSHRRQLVPAVVTFCSVLAGTDAWAAHAAAAAAQPGVPRDILHLCLSHAAVLAVALPLPHERRPPGCEWDSVGHVFGLLHPSRLLPEGTLAACFEAGGSDGAAAAIAAVAQLVRLLPLDQPLPGQTEQEQRDLLATALHVLGNTCVTFGEQPAIWRRLKGQQRRRVAAHLLPLATQLPQLLPLVAGSMHQPGTQEHASSIPVLGAVSCQLALLCNLRKGEQDEQLGQGGRLQPPPQAAPLVGSRADAVAWCEAACGALQCLPLVQQIYSTRPHSAAPEYAGVAVTFVYAAAAGLTPASGDLPGRTLTAADEALHTAIWQLANRLSQLVHAAAAAGSPLAPLRDALGTETVLCALSECMAAAVILEHMDSGAQHLADGWQAALTSPLPRSQPTKRLRALGAAYAAALQTCQDNFDVVQQEELHAASTLCGLAAAMGYGPMAVGLDPALHQVLQQLWSRVEQQGQHSHQVWLHSLYGATGGPCCAALLTAGGQLDTILSRFGQDVLMRGKVTNVVDTVRYEASRAVAAAQQPVGAGGPSSSSAAAANEAALLEQLRQALAAVDGFMVIAVGSQDAVPQAARRLAAALLDWWRRPSVQQEQQLEAAQAAAARSCAYLRCANLGGSGGPAAGQGEGSQRCSACRAVWYCGTACSHADWRAGHRRMCRALGEARAAARAARRQAAAAVGVASDPES